MPFTASFSVSQGGNPNNIVLTDTSSGGSDPNLTGRKIYLTKSDGTFLVPEGSTNDYIDWAIADSSITIEDILSRDYSLNIVVEWETTVPIVGATYEYTLLYTFTALIESFYYSLTRRQTSNPLLVDDNNYFYNKSKLRTEIDSAVNATTYSDQYAAQSCLDRAYAFQVNETTYF